MRHLKTLWQTVRIIVHLERCVMTYEGYADLQNIECASEDDRNKIEDACTQLESISKKVYEKKNFTIVPLSET